MSALQWFGVIALSIVVLLFALGSLFGHASRNRANYKDVSFSREDILAKVNSDFAESEQGIRDRTTRTSRTSRREIRLGWSSSVFGTGPCRP